MHDPPALPPVSKEDARFWRFLSPVTMTFDPSKFKLKTATAFIRTMGNVCTNFDFSAFLLFSSCKPMYLKDGQAKRIMWPIG